MARCLKTKFVTHEVQAVKPTLRSQEEQKCRCTNPLRQRSGEAHKIPSINQSFFVARKRQMVPNHEELNCLRYTILNTKTCIPKYVTGRNQVSLSVVFRRPTRGQDDDRLLHAGFPADY